MVYDVIPLFPSPQSTLLILQRKCGLAARCIGRSSLLFIGPTVPRFGLVKVGHVNNISYGSFEPHQKPRGKNSFLHQQALQLLVSEVRDTGWKTL